MRSFCGFLKDSSGSLSSMLWSAPIKNTRSATVLSKPIIWVTHSMVMPDSARPMGSTIPEKPPRQIIQTHRPVPQTNQWAFSHTAWVNFGPSLAMPAPVANDDQTVDDASEPPASTYPCPACGGRMVIIETFQPGATPRHPRQRAPPQCPSDIP